MMFEVGDLVAYTPIGSSASYLGYISGHIDEFIGNEQWYLVEFDRSRGSLPEAESTLRLVRRNNGLRKYT